jgi:hypothetical protein
MMTRETLAAMTDEELYHFIGRSLDRYDRALTDCELLRRPGFMREGGIRSILWEWERKPVPPSVPELRPLLRKAREILGPDNARLGPLEGVETDKEYEFEDPTFQAFLTKLDEIGEFCASGGPWPGIKTSKAGGAR